jgi:hypothetical protein
MRRKELQGNKSMERNVLRLVDDAHAATPDRLDDAVVRDGSPEQRGTVRHFALILGGTARQVNEDTKTDRLDSSNDYWKFRDGGY